MEIWKQHHVQQTISGLITDAKNSIFGSGLGSGSVGAGAENVFDPSGTSAGSFASDNLVAGQDELLLENQALADLENMGIPEIPDAIDSEIADAALLEEIGPVDAIDVDIADIGDLGDFFG